MSSEILLSTFLTLHIIALTLMAGTTTIDYITFRSFWKLFDQKRETAIDLLQVTAKFSRVIGIGAAVLILTGLGMMILTHGVFGEQLWFRIKFALVILLILNGLLVGRRQGVKLRKITTDPRPDFTEQIKNIRITLKRFHLTQLGIFFVIIFLSVFKFN